MAKQYKIRNLVVSLPDVGEGNLEFCPIDYVTYFPPDPGWTDPCAFGGRPTIFVTACAIDGPPSVGPRCEGYSLPRFSANGCCLSNTPWIAASPLVNPSPLVKGFVAKGLLTKAALSQMVLTVSDTLAALQAIESSEGGPATMAEANEVEARLRESLAEIADIKARLASSGEA